MELTLSLVLGGLGVLFVVAATVSLLAFRQSQRTSAQLRQVILILRESRVGDELRTSGDPFDFRYGKQRSGSAGTVFRGSSEEDLPDAWGELSHWSSAVERQRNYGGFFDQDPERRTIASIYIAGSADEGVALREAVRDALETYELTLVATSRPELGSWFQIFKVRGRKVLSEPEVKRRLNELENAARLHGVDNTRSQVDERKAAAVANLMSAIQDQEEALVRLGTIVIVKHAGQTVIETISEGAARDLEQNSAMLKNPASAMEFLRLRQQPPTESRSQIARSASIYDDVHKCSGDNRSVDKNDDTEPDGRQIPPSDMK